MVMSEDLDDESSDHQVTRHPCVVTSHVFSRKNVMLFLEIRIPSTGNFSE